MRKLLFVLLVLPLISLGSVSLSHACCVDQDQDGYGVEYLELCPKPELDCDDTRADVNAGATEICNDIDDNCDDVIDDVDADLDGFIDAGCGGEDCDDSNPDVNPAAVEGCCVRATCKDHVDNNCNGRIDVLDPGCLAWCMSELSSTMEAEIPVSSKRVNFLAVLILPLGAVLILMRIRRK